MIRFILTKDYDDMSRKAANVIGAQVVSKPNCVLGLATGSTPIGTYNPDWAVLWEKNGEQKLYFILETKGSTSLFDLRTPEQLKIHCGIEHFKALDNGVEMHVAKDWEKFKINQ